MPWSSTYYPASMKNLPLPVREKAIEVANGCSPPERPASTGHRSRSNVGTAPHVVNIGRRE